MTNPSANPMDVVAGLMLERQRLEQWIAQLEAKRAITPPHVFERVKADYDARLKAVVDQLMGRTTELQETITALTNRLGRLQSEETRARDERYEAELRAAVGELSPGEWTRIQTDGDREIARVATERSAVTAELARLQQILSMARAEGRTLAPTNSGEGPARRDSGPLSADSAAAAARPPGGRRFDELEFLKSVVEPHGEGKGRDRAASENGAANDPAARPARPSVQGVSPVTSSKPETPTVAGRTTPNAPAPSPPIIVPTKVDEPGEVPSFLKDVPVEQVRTLPCAECSAMNYPTEWYCERCGAELAQM